MDKTDSLSIPLSVKLGLLEKQMARAEAMMFKSAKKIERGYERANNNPLQKITRSAEASARVFESAIEKETRALERLRSSLDPVYAGQFRYQSVVKQVQSAVRMGAITQQDANTMLAQARAAYLGAASGANQASAASGRFYAMSGQGRFVMQNVAYQVGDFAVQVGAGTSAMRAASMQVPQLLGAFGALGGAMGVLGPLLGTVAAIGFPVAAFLLATGENAAGATDDVKDFADAFERTEAAINAANAAINHAGKSSYDDLKRMYGEVNDELKNLLIDVAKIETDASLKKLSTSFDEFFDHNKQPDSLIGFIEDGIEDIEYMREQIKILQDQLEGGNTVFIRNTLLNDIAKFEANIKEIEEGLNLVSEFKIDPDVAENVKTLWLSIKEAVDENNLDVFVSRFNELRSIFKALPEDSPLKNLYIELTDLEQQARETIGSIKAYEKLGDELNFDGAKLSAGQMADEIERAADALARLSAQGYSDLAIANIRYEFRNDPVELAGQLAAYKFDQDTKALRHAGFENEVEEVIYLADRDAFIENARAAASKREETRASNQKPFDLFGNSDKQITSLQRQVEMVGKSAQEVAELTAKYELLDAAKEKGIALDQKSLETGRTVRQEIEAQAKEIGELTTKAQEYADQAALMDNATQDMKDGFIDAIIEGKNFGDVLGDIAKKLAKAALEAALFGKSGVFPNFGISTGSNDGGLFGGAIIPGVLHSGGVAGVDGYGHGRAMAASTWSDAPRYHRGGIAGLRGDEVPAILQRGELVIPKGGAVARSGKGNLTVNIHNAPDGNHRVQQSPDGRTLDVYIQNKAIDAVTGLDGQRAMAQTFGLRPKPMGV